MVNSSLLRMYESLARHASGVMSEPGMTPASTRALPVSYDGSTLPLGHCVMLTMMTPRLVASRNSLSMSFRLDGAFPEPYVCRTTPLIGDWRKARIVSPLILGKILLKVCLFSTKVMHNNGTVIVAAGQAYLSKVTFRFNLECA